MRRGLTRRTTEDKNRLVRAGSSRVSHSVPRDARRAEDNWRRWFVPKPASRRAAPEVDLDERRMWVAQPLKRSE
jgi:hypothetical protein